MWEGVCEGKVSVSGVHRAESEVQPFHGAGEAAREITLC